MGTRDIMEQSPELTSLVRRLNRIGIALSSEHNLGKLLEMIVTELRTFTRSDGGSLYLKDGDRLSFEVAQNDTLSRRFGSVPFKSLTLPVNTRSIVGYVASSGISVNIPNLAEAGDDLLFSLDTLREFDRNVGLETVSVLAVPMRDHTGDIIGVIQLFNALGEDERPIPFSSAMEELVTSLASQAAVALANSRLIRNIRNLFEGLVTYSAQAIDARSPHTAGHSMRVSKLVMAQATAINRSNAGCWAAVAFSEAEMEELRMAAWLHDLGKIGVREYVLDKVNKLADDRIETIAARFRYLQKDAENRGNLRKLELARQGEMTPERSTSIDHSVRRECEKLQSDLAFVFQVNKPGFLSDEDMDRLKRVAERTYIDPDGCERPLLEPFEREHLAVRKGNLTTGEREEIQRHVHHTINILKKIPFTEELKNIPRYAAAHHELLDGSGYPGGLQGKEIPLQSQIITIADIYEALTAQDRPYKPPLPTEDALQILQEEARAGKLDKELVDLFISEGVYHTLP